MSLEKIIITNQEISVSKRLYKNKLDDPLLKFYDNIKSRTGGSLEGNISIDAIETFLGAYGVVKQKLTKASTLMIGDCRESIGLYSLYLAASHAHSILSKHIHEELPFHNLSRIESAKDDYLLVNELITKHLDGTRTCRTGKELAQMTKGYFTKIKDAAQSQLSRGNHANVLKGLEKVEISFEEGEQSYKALKQKKTRKKKKRAKEDEEITFKDVGGCNEVKTQLMYLVKSIMHPEKTTYGYRPPKGVFFYGIPGTGKTLLAKALANECGLDFHHIDLSDIVSKWYGESEQNLKEAMSQKGIIFLDEYDSIGKKGGEGYGGDMSVKLVNIIAEKMDGYDANEEAIFVAAANSLKIEEKLKRAGRFDKFYYFGPPGQQDIKEILMIRLRKMQESAKVQLFNGVQADYVAKALYQRSLQEQKVNSRAAIVGADITEIARRVHEKKWNKFLDTGKFNKISTEDFYDEIVVYSLQERFSNEIKR